MAKVAKSAILFILLASLAACATTMDEKAMRDGMRGSPHGGRGNMSLGDYPEMPATCGGSSVFVRIGMYGAGGGFIIGVSFGAPLAGAAVGAGIASLSCYFVD